MIVSIHQPHFLPWAGYVNKALSSNVFVWLHSVQYRKNYYQNRTKIKNINGEPLWLTLPVHAKLGMAIDQVTVADPRWRERVQKTVEQCYRKAPFFAQCWPPLAEAITESPDNLNEANLRTFSAVLRILGAGSLRVVQVGDLPAKSEEPTLRLVEICTALGATHYIAGKGGANYLRSEEFDRVGITVVWQSFDPAALVYPQVSGPFLPGLSVIDLLFNVGPGEASKLLKNAWVPATVKT